MSDKNSAGINASLDQINFINMVKPGAILSFHNYRILPSLTIAQAILESNWGTSELATEANNLFGMKWNGDYGYDYVVKQTREVVGNEWIVTKAKFKKYNSINDSIADHAQLLQKPQYNKVLTAKDYKEAAYEVWKAGYASDPGYPQKLIDINEKYELYKIDMEVLNSDIRLKDFDQVAGWAKEAVKNVFDEGIMIGDDLGYFNPSMPCTRQEIAVIAYRLMKLIK